MFIRCFKNVIENVTIFGVFVIEFVSFDAASCATVAINSIWLLKK